MTRVRAPLTDAQRAIKAEGDRQWRARNQAHLRRYGKENREAINARRRKNYARSADEKRARCREWKRRNVARVREYNQFVINPQRRAGGKYDGLKYRERRAWRAFVAVCASNRRRLEALA